MVTHNSEYIKYATHTILMIDGDIKRDEAVNEQNKELLLKNVVTQLNQYADITNTQENPTDQTIFPTSVVFSETLAKKNIFENIIFAIAFNIRFSFQLLFIIWLQFLKLIS